MRKGMAAGLLSLLLALSLSVVGCAQAGDTGDGGGGGEEEIGRVTVMGVWGGGEVEAFQSVTDEWEADTGGTMEFEGTRDLSAILRARVSGGNPPDLAVLPNPALLEEFAKAGALKPIGDIVDEDQLSNDFSKTWIEQGTADGKLYGLFVKAAPKSTVWYDPKTFSAKGWETPKSWDELVSLSKTIAADGTPPWSIGVEAGAASGWPASDWIQEILLAESGPDTYDKWVNHEIPWTDPAVKSAFEHFGEIVHGEGMVLGGPKSVVSTNFQDAMYPPFQNPPEAQMVFLGAFGQGFIADQFPDLKAGEDYDFFDFPAVDPQYDGAATGGADIIVMFNDTASARSLLKYLAKGDSWEPWAKAGGYTTPNQGLDEGTYPDDLARKAAQQLTDSKIFRFDADDMMPAELQNAYWSGLLQYIQNPDSLDQVLKDIEGVAAQAYENKEQ